MIVLLRTCYAEEVYVGVNPDDVSTVTHEFFESVGKWSKDTCTIEMKTGEKFCVSGLPSEVVKRLNGEEK